MSKPKSSYTLWIAGYVIKGLFSLLIFAVCALLLWRVLFSQRAPKELRSLSPNPVLWSVLEEGGDLTLLYQDGQVPYTQGEHNHSYFQLDWCYFIREADQVQLVLFYNDSTLERIKESYGLAEVPPKGEEVFNLLLTQYVDLTPNDKSDNTDGSAAIEKKEIAPTSCKMATTSLYTFALYTFDGVSLDDCIVVYLDILFGENADVCGTLRLYHEENNSTEKALTDREKRYLDRAE